MSDSVSDSKKGLAEKERIFFDKLRETGNVTAATQAAGLDRSAVYRKRNSNKKFRQAWQEAMEEALDKLEAIVWEKAMGSNDNDQQSTVKSADEKLAIFLLKAHRPEIFGDGKLRKRPEGSGMDNSSARKKLLSRIDQITRQK